MKPAALLFAIAFSMAASAQQPNPPQDPWQAVSFLLGTWEARTSATAPATAVGTYSFYKDLNGHVMSRHSATASCAGPSNFDCQHTDLLHIYQDPLSGNLKAIYLDSEGHVIRYSVATSDSSTVVLLSEPGPGPRFRLVYHLEGSVMVGKFQAQTPGQDGWTSYLEWSGARR